MKYQILFNNDCSKHWNFYAETIYRTYANDIADCLLNVYNKDRVRIDEIQENTILGKIIGKPLTD